MTDDNRERIDSLCVVMPVYNEQEAIGSVLEKWDTMLKNLGIKYQIRPYNDGSRDGSLEVMRRVAQRLGPQIDVRDKANGGHGHTVLTGYREAATDGFDWVFQVDSDDEMGPEKFCDFWAHRKNFDFLVGIRDGRKQALPRKIISFISRLCVRIFYGKSIWDVNVPYRLMRVSTFRDFYFHIPASTFAPNVILSGLAASHGLRCYEARVPQHDRSTGEVSIRKWRLLMAAVKSFWQTMMLSLDSHRGWCVFAFIAVVSTGLKFCSSLKCCNFDFESYEIVANIVKSGGNVYAETDRYNYGPVWFITLGWIQSLFGVDNFRAGIIFVLGLVDVGIGALLWRRKLFGPTFLFLLSNISIHISGCHNQFDNLAVFAALSACMLLDSCSGASRGGGWKYWCGVLSLGVSITIKHVFIFMPFWFLFRRMPWKRRIICCALPLFMFIGSFLPYSRVFDMDLNKRTINAVSDASREFIEQAKTTPRTKWLELGKTCYETRIRPVKHPAVGIVKNVFLYQSKPTGDFERCFVPEVIASILPPFLIFVFTMLGLGYIVRDENWFYGGLLYTLGLFTFTPSMAMQYYAIPCAAAAIFWRPFGLIFHLVGSVAFFHYGWLSMLPCFRVFSMMMTLGCLCTALRAKIRVAIRATFIFLARKLQPYFES